MTSYAYRLHLPPDTGEGSDYYAPWFASNKLVALTEAESDFLLTVVVALSDDRIDTNTACFAEADFLISGWHTADQPQPDRTSLYRFWSLLLDDTHLSVST